MAAHQALSFSSNTWSPSSTKLLQQPRQQSRHHHPETVSFHQRKRPRSSISSSSSSSSRPFLSSTYTNPNVFINANNNINPFTPIQPIINNNINPFFPNQITTNNNTHSNHHLFSTDIYGTSSFIDPPLSTQTLIPLYQDEEYYHTQNSLDFIYPQNTLPDDHPILDFSSPEDQILLAPLLVDPLPTTCLPDNNIVLKNERVVETTNPNDDHYHLHHQNQRPKNGSAVVVSPQSIAARERRRKITKRTSELGKLIPGGNKMSTAEMFQAAYKYVKFLQTQVSLLQLLASSNKDMKEEQLYVKELQVLASPIIQEKLYSEEMCIVPTKFLDQILAKNQIALVNAIKH